MGTACCPTSTKPFRAWNRNEPSLRGRRFDFERDPHGTCAALDLLVEATADTATSMVRCDSHAIQIDEVVVAHREPSAVRALVVGAGRKNLTKGGHNAIDLRDDGDAGLACDDGELFG